MQKLKWINTTLEIVHPIMKPLTEQASIITRIEIRHYRVTNSLEKIYKAAPSNGKSSGCSLTTLTKRGTGSVNGIQIFPYIS